MDFEELALKSVDTSLAPKIINLNRSKEKVPEKTQPTPIVSWVLYFHDRLANLLTQFFSFRLCSRCHG